MEMKLIRAEELIRICKLNIENQKVKLEQTNKKLGKIQNIIASINTIAQDEFEKLINIDDKLMVNVEANKRLILELQGDLNINKNNLHELKSHQLCSFF